MAASELRPDLRLVPTSRVRFHEHPERRRTLRLLERIKADAYLRNPPIVAEMNGGDYLLLDGANRISVFQELGYSHVPVQVVDYGDASVQLKGWHHLILQGAELHLKMAYEALPGVAVRPVQPRELARLLELRQVFAVLVENEAAWWGLYPNRPEVKVDIQRRIRTLEAVVAAYEGQSRLERIKLADYDLLPEVVHHVEHQVCLYPTLRKEELLQAAGEGIMIPTGLTRHIIPGRALGLSLDLAFLREESSDEAKIAHFQKFVDDLVMDGRIRFYEESVFIMNE